MSLDSVNFGCALYINMSLSYTNIETLKKKKGSNNITKKKRYVLWQWTACPHKCPKNTEEIEK